MKYIIILIGLLSSSAYSLADDSPKTFQREMEAAFAHSPVVVDGWIRRSDGKRGRMEFHWSTHDENAIRELRDLITHMERSNYSIPPPGGTSDALYLKLSSGKTEDSGPNYVYVTFSGIGTRSVEASHDPSRGYFDLLANLVYGMYVREMKVRATQ